MYLQKKLSWEKKNKKPKNFWTPVGFEPATLGFFCFLVLYKIPLTVVSGVEVSPISGNVMAPLCERITNLFGSTPLSTTITAMIQEKSNTYYISEPIIRKCFPKTCATSFTSEQFHWFVLLWKYKTLQHFHTSPDSCSLFLIPSLIFSFLS